MPNLENTGKCPLKPAARRGTVNVSKKGVQARVGVPQRFGDTREGSIPFTRLSFCI